MQLFSLYLALVQPHLEHCIWFQSPQHKKNVKVLESIQTRTPKLVPGQEGMSSERELSALGLLSLEESEKQPHCSLQLPEEGKQWEVLSSAPEN